MRICLLMASSRYGGSGRVGLFPTAPKLSSSPIAVCRVIPETLIGETPTRLWEGPVNLSRG